MDLRRSWSAYSCVGSTHSRHSRHSRYRHPKKGGEGRWQAHSQHNVARLMQLRGLLGSGLKSRVSPITHTRSTPHPHPARIKAATSPPPPPRVPVPPPPHLLSLLEVYLDECAAPQVLVLPIILSHCEGTISTRRPDVPGRVGAERGRGRGAIRKDFFKGMLGTKHDMHVSEAGELAASRHLV